LCCGELCCPVFVPYSKCFAAVPVRYARVPERNAGLLHLFVRYANF
jgi:hypothetical protein